MKKILSVLLFTSLLISACSERIFMLGTSEKDFVRQTTGAIQIEATQQRTVYKKVDYGFGHPPSVKFFYFRDGILFQIDEGVRRPDVLIENVH